MQGRYTCRLCYGRQTNSILTLAGNIDGPCLPVCIVCIPPWINDRTHKWWYEVKDHHHTQRRPTVEEVNDFMRLRTLSKVQFERDDDLYNKCLSKDYKTLWAIDDLLSHWNEERSMYDW